MSMYVDLLSKALDDWVEALGGGDLVDYALACRMEMLSAVPRKGESTYAALAAEIAYDRALIKLCRVHDISVGPENFVYPRQERDHLEGLLAVAGIDLSALARSRRN